jgi:MoaA/NifB/PqqE/SkfB family radical SAM enzyme
MIKQVHYEITDKCNARCPQCGRTNRKNSTTQPWISNNEMSLEDFKEASPPEFISYIKSCYFCGNAGDPLANKNFMNILKYCFENNPSISISTSSNCSLKSERWWKELGSFTKNKHFRIIAGIDGISQETHSLYRVNTYFEKIMKNLKSYINAGGEAVWQFIIFKHNENEIEIAKQMSKDIGFKEFRFFNSNRFSDPNSSPNSKIGNNLKMSSSYVYKNVKKTIYPSTIKNKKYTDRQFLTTEEIYND